MTIPVAEIGPRARKSSTKRKSGSMIFDRNPNRELHLAPLFDPTMLRLYQTKPIQKIVSEWLFKKLNKLLHGWGQDLALFVDDR